jgi:2-octaprenylphenol hydroxylase
VNSAHQRCEVLIVGGGVTGLALAALLGRAGIPVAVIEADEPQQDWLPDSMDLRVYAISRVSQRLFEQAGAWPAMLPRACAYGDMHVWDAGGNGEIHFDSADLGEPDLGHIIESRVIVSALLEVLEELPSVRICCPARVQSIGDAGGRQRLELEDGQVLDARLLVGADGRNSRVRDSAGIHAVVSEYGQQALVCVVETERPHQHTAWQRFLPTGPLAFLPLFDGRCSIVWSATSSEARRLLGLDDVAFCAALGEAFDYRLGNIKSCGERVLFRLVRQYAENYVKPGVALIGDAAHVIHPLAGQGVNLGLKDVLELGEVVQQALQVQRDPGSLAVLRRYERARRGDMLATMTAMDGFKHMFGSRNAPLRLARNLGLNLVNNAVPVKNMIMRQAMGL